MPCGSSTGFVAVPVRAPGLNINSPQAKILRMSCDAEGAIKVLRKGLKPERPHTFAQADGLVSSHVQDMTKADDCIKACFRTGMDATRADAIPRSCRDVFADYRVE